MRTTTRVVATLAGLAVLVGGCGAAAQIRSLQPPAVKAVGKITLPAVSAVRPSRFQAGIDIDSYHYRGHHVGLYVSLRPLLDEKSRGQSRVGSAACQGAVATQFGGIYFWSIGLAQNSPIGPTLASQTTWTGGPGARAIAGCFGKITR